MSLEFGRYDTATGKYSEIYTLKSNQYNTEWIKEIQQKIEEKELQAIEERSRERTKWMEEAIKGKSDEEVSAALHKAGQEYKRELDSLTREGEEDFVKEYLLYDNATPDKSRIFGYLDGYLENRIAAFSLGKDKTKEEIDQEKGNIRSEILLTLVRNGASDITLKHLKFTAEEIQKIREKIPEIRARGDSGFFLKDEMYEKYMQENPASVHYYRKYRTLIRNANMASPLPKMEDDAQLALAWQVIADARKTEQRKAQGYVEGYRMGRMATLRYFLSKKLPKEIILELGYSKEEIGNAPKIGIYGMEDYWGVDMEVLLHKDTVDDGRLYAMTFSDAYLANYHLVKDRLRNCGNLYKSEVNMLEDHEGHAWEDMIEYVKKSEYTISSGEIWFDENMRPIDKLYFHVGEVCRNYREQAYHNARACILDFMVRKCVPLEALKIAGYSDEELEDYR